mmetsp:Transcript_19063/g.32332  ORF Transcript_19063/g.32332 Transcript_19063/m.32332 type:complete len:258 (+) Transcript_19063:127-900(+)
MTTHCYNTCLSLSLSLLFPVTTHVPLFVFVRPPAHHPSTRAEATNRGFSSVSSLAAAGGQGHRHFRRRVTAGASVWRENRGRLPPFFKRRALCFRLLLLTGSLLADAAAASAAATAAVLAEECGQFVLLVRVSDLFCGQAGAVAQSQIGSSVNEHGRHLNMPERRHVVKCGVTVVVLEVWVDAAVRAQQPRQNVGVVPKRRLVQRRPTRTGLHLQRPGSTGDQVLCPLKRTMHHVLAKFEAQSGDRSWQRRCGLLPH